MRYIFTTFDYKKYPVVPLESLVIDDDICWYTFYKPNTGLTLKQIENNKKLFGELFDDEVMVNDFKSHILAFGLNRDVGYRVYDMNLYSNLQLSRKQIATVLNAVMSDCQADLWRKLLSNAMVVYQYLEDQGVRDNYKKVYPKYNLNTVTGRSSTTGFNLQGTTDKYDIRPVIDEYDFLVHFDWLAADVRMISFMSGDEKMQNTFKDSDPYIKASEYLNDPEFDRGRCKKEFITSIYSLSVDAPILQIYPQFNDWMRNKITELENNEFLTSIMGRKFVGDKLRVFNSQFQGSVAHCMHAALIKIYERYKNNLLTEVHDSIILHCKENRLNELIRSVSSIMLYPLDGWISNPPRMPVRISVGKKWRQWKEYKVVR